MSLLPTLRLRRFGKKLRLVMFKVIRKKASWWTDLLIPNPYFFY